MPADTLALQPTDTLPVGTWPDVHVSHPYWRATGEVLFVNTFFQLWDQFVLNLEYSNITMSSIRQNFQRGWVWDNDNFMINQIGHPYQGSLYYSGARASGLSYWQSLPYCLLGSVTWEYFCETDPPAINDVITTPLGGAALGEITWRLSGMVLDDSSRGMRRFWREAAALCLNPMRGINRIVSGEAWRYRPGSRYRYHDPEEFPVHGMVGIGGRHLNRDFDRRHGDYNAQLTARLVYGDEFSEEDVHPYDYFVFNVEAGFGGYQPWLQQVNVLGRLWGHLHETRHGHEVQAGFYQHFNFYNSADVEGGGDAAYAPFLISETASFGPGIIMRQKDHSGFFHWTHYAYLSGILLGATKSDNYNILERTYNMGSGYSIRTGTMHQWGNVASLAFTVDHYHLFTWKDYDADYVARHEDLHYLNAPGNKGHTLMDIVQLSFGWHFSRHFSWMLEPTYYFRQSHYAAFPTVTYRTFEVSSSIVWRM